MEDFIANSVMPLLMAFMVALVSYLLTMAANYLKKKTGIAISADKMKLVEGFAIQAVLKAEGRAQRYLVSKGEKLTGASKHAVAVNNILAMAPDLTHEDAKHYVDMAVAMLPGKAGK